MSTELFIIFCLLLLNGLFAMAEAAVIASRKARLKTIAENGSSRAKLTLATVSDPLRFLSAIQVGITLIGVLAGALAADQTTAGLSTLIAKIPYVSAHTAHTVALAVIVGSITLCSVVLGELLPKRLALHRPERVALVLTPIINKFARLVSPLINLLAHLTNLVLKPFGLAQKPSAETPVSNEELNIIIEEGKNAGVFNEAEQQMLEAVLTLDQIPVTAIMTPRPKIQFINIDDPEDITRRKIIANSHSRYPVYQGSYDQILGIVSVKSIWANSAFGLNTQLKDLLVPALIVPETMLAITLLEEFKKSAQHVALVANEFGSIQGLVSLFDVLQAIVGDIRSAGQKVQPEVHRRDDNTLLIDATLPTAELKELLNLDTLPYEDRSNYQTLGGLIMTHFGRIPKTGDTFTDQNWKFEVIDMDRHRVDKVLLTKIQPPTTPDTINDTGTSTTPSQNGNAVP